jgi:hypothetical protein
MPPRVLRLRTPSPCSVGLCYCHASRGFVPRRPARRGSSVATRPAVLDLTSLLGGVLVQQACSEARALSRCARALPM